MYKKEIVLATTVVSKCRLHQDNFSLKFSYGKRALNAAAGEAAVLGI